MPKVDVFSAANAHFQFRMWPFLVPLGVETTIPDEQPQPFQMGVFPPPPPPLPPNQCRNAIYVGDVLSLGSNNKGLMLEVSAISIVMATGIHIFLATITFASD